MLTWPETCPFSAYFLLKSFGNKKITCFDFFTHVYLIPIQLLLHLHPDPKQSLCFHEMWSLAHALWFIAHVIFRFLCDAQTLHHLSIFNKNSLTFFLLMVIFFSLDGNAFLCLSFTWLEVPCRNDIAGMKDEKLCTDLRLHLWRLSPQTRVPVFGQFMQYWFKGGKITVWQLHHILY